MVKEKAPEEVYETFAEQGLYEEAGFDKDEVEKVKMLCVEDYEFGKKLRNLENPNWRVIFNINYDVLRELCSQLMRFKRQKISNHKGLFAFIVLNYPNLELDWKFFETIRNMRNQSKYTGLDIKEDMWKSVKIQMDLYISAIKKEVENKIQ